jgi:hypothetical protein
MNTSQAKESTTTITPIERSSRNHGRGRGHTVQRGKGNPHAGYTGSVPLMPIVFIRATLVLPDQERKIVFEQWPESDAIRQVLIRLYCGGDKNVQVL